MAARAEPLLPLAPPLRAAGVLAAAAGELLPLLLLQLKPDVLAAEVLDVNEREEGTGSEGRVTEESVVVVSVAVRFEEGSERGVLGDSVMLLLLLLLPLLLLVTRSERRCSRRRRCCWRRSDERLLFHELSLQTLCVRERFTVDDQR